MSFIGGGGGASGPANALRFSPTRGRMQNNYTSGVGYPSPFFDVAHTYMPATVKALFKWCRYYFLTNPLINATVFKLSEYPITDIIVEHENPQVADRWTEYLQDHLRYRGFQVECGLDYHTYGNTLVSMGFPFHKYLYCQSCDFREAAHQIRDKWVFTNYGFRLTCPRCGEIGDASARDFYFRNASGIKLIRWNAEDVDITYNDLTGEYTHFYTVPSTIRNDIVVGKKDVVESIPQVYIQALREQKGIIFAKSNLFHMKRPGLATLDRGWGTPLLLPVLKDTFYLQVMKKAQEAILLEHIVPLRILFPQAGSGTTDPYTTLNLVDWRDHVAQEIARWRHDNNYIPIMPLPIGNQTIGGDGRALLLTQEIQTWSEQIMVGMGVPREFLLGGMSYAGTNVSMRMLENAFIGYCLRHKALVRFVMQSVAWYMGWPEVKIRFKPFKMADDLQRKAYRFQMNQAGKMSDTTLLADDDLDQRKEDEIMIKESDSRLEATKKNQLALAQIQGEAQLIMMKYQAKAQTTMQQAAMAPLAPGEPGGPEALAGGTPGGQALEPQMAPSGMQEPGGQPAQALPADAAQTMQSQIGQGYKMQLPGGQQAANVDLPSMAASQARLIATMDPGMQQLAVSNLRAQSPELADLVVQILGTMGISVATSGQAQQPMQPGQGPQVDLRPLPEQRSPRRDTTLV